MKKLFLTWQDVEHQTQEILRQIQKDNWTPDYIVGLTRGGLVPANLISQYLECPMHTLKVSLRDDTERLESSVWLGDEAFANKKILIVDDINDTGATLSWIKRDWMSPTPNSDRWDQIWGENVRVAVLYDNESSRSTLTADYSAVTINKAEEDCWVVFPWEDWWIR